MSNPSRSRPFVISVIERIEYVRDQTALAKGACKPDSRVLHSVQSVACSPFCMRARGPDSGGLIVLLAPVFMIADHVVKSTVTGERPRNSTFGRRQRTRDTMHSAQKSLASCVMSAMFTSAG